MPNSNQHILSPQSTEYLTSKIESDNFTDNSADLIINTTLFTGGDGTVAQTPRVARTGNILVYLSGFVTAQGAVAATDLIASIPTTFSSTTLFDATSLHPVITNNAGTIVGDAISVGLNANGTQIDIAYAGTTGLIAADIIYLNNVFFFINNR